MLADFARPSTCGIRAVTDLRPHGGEKVHRNGSTENLSLQPGLVERESGARVGALDFRAAGYIKQRH
jgi:hypothetical protein